MAKMHPSIVSAIFAKKSPSMEEPEQMEPMEGEDQEMPNDDAGLESCAQELIQAIEAKDVQGVVQSLKSAFQIIDSQPHAEGEHEEEEQPEGEI